MSWEIAQYIMAILMMHQTHVHQALRLDTVSPSLLGYKFGTRLPFAATESCLQAM